MTTQYWLVKTEPATYAFSDLVRDGRTEWTGVRNYAARNHLKAMRAGDAVLVSHSGDAKAVVGLARVTRAAYPDPTAEEDGWVAVTLAAGAAFKQPVALAAIKADAALQGMVFVRQGRLSVSPVTAREFARLRKLGG